MSAEFLALQQQGTWDLIPAPSSPQNILGCRWTFKTKRHSNGTVARYKARLVAQGFNQEHGIDYHETFSLIAKFVTIRTLLLVALHNQRDVVQLDVSNAFLHGKLDDNIYMFQPPGYKDTQYPDRVFLLKKAIYGLKQAPC